MPVQLVEPVERMVNRDVRYRPTMQYFMSVSVFLSVCLSVCLSVSLSLSVSLRHMCKTTTDRKQVSLDATPLKCMPPHSHICTHMTLTVDLCPRKAFRPTHMLITCAKFHLNPSIM